MRNLTIADAPETFQRKVTQNKEESKEIGGENENEHSSQGEYEEENADRMG